MSTPSFEALTRQTATALSRRASLLTLGGAALAASAAHPGLSKAKKKSGDKCKKQEQQRCKKDTAACRALAPIVCDDEQCEEILALCCEKCATPDFVRCAFQFD